MDSSGPYDWREDEDDEEPVDWRSSMALGVIAVVIVALLMLVR